MPFAIKDALGAKLDRLECEGIPKKVLGLLQLLQYITDSVFVGAIK